MSYSTSADRIAGSDGRRGMERTGNRMNDTIRIRKYPNRRLYDTSRSQHLTHDGVLALIAEGHTVQVTDSRTGTDITNAVLLQIMIERDPAKVASLPSEIIHRAMRSDATTIRGIAEGALAAWRGEPNDASMTAVAPTTTVKQPIVTPSVRPTQPAAVPSVAGLDANGRPKAKAKRLDGSPADVS